jgi:hypothetical protein
MGVVRPFFGCEPLLFPLSPSFGKVQTHKVPFSSEVPLCLPAFPPFFLLDPVFFLFYTLPIKKQLLIKKSEYRGGITMGLQEKIIQKVNNLPETEKAEVLDFIEYLKTKSGKKERKVWNDFSLSSAMRGMEDEPALYSVEDIRESF